MTHFEIVRTDVGHHARLEGDNQEAVWTTEVYTEFRGAQDAIMFLCRTLVPNYGVAFDGGQVTGTGPPNGHVTLNLDADPMGDKLSIAVKLVDKRGENDVAYRGDES